MKDKKVIGIKIGEKPIFFDENNTHIAPNFPREIPDKNDWSIAELAELLMKNMNKITGKKRQKLKSTIRSMKHQHAEYGLTELELLKLTDLENELKRKKK